MQVTQKSKILNYLRGGSELSSIQAVQLFGATRLAAVVHELKRCGYEINDEWRDGEDAKYKVWFMEHKGGRNGL